MAESDERTYERARWRVAGMWILTGMSRTTLAGSIALAFFFLLVLATAVAPSSLLEVIVNKDALRYTFSAMVTALVTAVTLVVTFNQLILSQELGPLGDQHERMQDARSFREELEPRLAEDVSPASPSGFLASMLDAVESLATELETAAERNGDATAEIGAFVASVRGNARSVSDSLEDAEFGTFDVVSAVLDFNYSLKTYEARQIRAEYGELLSEETDDVLEELIAVLSFFGPAREHFKTLYFQWELVNLSRRILYTAVPALLVSLWMLFSVHGPDVTGATLGVDNLVWLTCGATTVTLTPIFLLVSYVLRIATVTKRTLAMGPFVLRDTEREERSRE